MSEPHGERALLYEVMVSTPAVRYYRDEPVDEAVLSRILDRARFGPSGGNRQGWHVVVVVDPDQRARVADIYQRAWRAYAGDPSPDQPPTRRAAEDFAAALAAVPVHLLVVVRLDALALLDAALDRPSIVGGASVYPFVQNVLLACRAEGLGAALTTAATSLEHEVAALVGLPEGWALAALVAVGHPEPDRVPRRLSRRPVPELATRDRFGGVPWPAPEQE